MAFSSLFSICLTVFGIHVRTLSIWSLPPTSSASLAMPCVLCLCKKRKLFCLQVREQNCHIFSPPRDFSQLVLDTSFEQNFFSCGASQLLCDWPGFALAAWLALLMLSGQTCHLFWLILHLISCVVRYVPTSRKLRLFLRPREKLSLVCFCGVYK